MSDKKPAWYHDAEWEVARALARLWLWGGGMSDDEMAAKTYYVYAEDHLSLKNDKRIKITIELEELKNGT